MDSKCDDIPVRVPNSGFVFFCPDKEPFFIVYLGILIIAHFLLLWRTKLALLKRFLFVMGRIDIRGRSLSGHLRIKVR